MLEGLKKLARNLRSIDIERIIDDALEEVLPKIIELNTDQLMDGETSTGDNIRPYYSEDPYFKSKAHARGYAKWKQKITPNPDRYFDAPNLYINGYYHSLIKGAIKKDMIEIYADGFGAQFEPKYKNLYGLQPKNIEYIRNEILPRIRKSIEGKLKT